MPTLLPAWVVVEGPKGGGKSTLAKQIVDGLGYSCQHEGPPPEGDDSLLTYYARRLLSATRPTVFDRQYVGEMIYGPAWRKVARLSFTDLLLLKRLMDANGALLLLAVPTWAQCELRIEQRPPKKTSDGTMAERKALHEAWLKFICSKEWKLVAPENTYPWYAPPMTVASTLYKVDGFCAPKGVIGNPYAKALFVGDRAANPDDGFDLPFFCNVRSSKFFHESVMLSGLPEKKLAFVNAHLPNGQPRDLVDVLAKMITVERIVALGQNAEKRLRELTSDQLNHATVITVPHPQYVRRFRSHEQSKYAALLYEAAAGRKE